MFIIVLWNIFTFLTYGIDKHCAKKTLWRIPEKILLAEALFLGAFGALLGMQIFRHKTQKPKFQVLIPCFALVNAVALFALYPNVFTR